ncbi:hypothetical protein JOB18_008627 [Solea senegalensis]|uniref:Uncharacterized protein n=1 Tax=Solea senegalensis TaxID=28829 RepID=A0AAV6SKD7_SOLSE|nr:hypothetical protein JOB18_008627 [Solea senegalensis]
MSTAACLRGRHTDMDVCVSDVCDPVVVESYSDCDTCAAEMRNSEPIKDVRHIPRNKKPYTHESLAVSCRGQITVHGKLMSYTELCAAGPRSLIRPDIQSDVS